MAARRVSLTSVHPPVLAGVVRTESDGHRHHLYTPDADALVRALVWSEHAFGDLEVRSTSLEETFLALTGAAATTASTRAGRDLVVPLLLGASVLLRAVVVLAFWTLGAGSLAVWAYHRDEGRRFR